jgi:hypothetical protein
MRKYLVRTLLVGGAAAAAVALVAGQSSAAGTTITITGAGGTFSATSSNTVLSDTTSGQSFRCTTSTAGGNIANVTNAPLPYTVKQTSGATGAITSLTFSGCTSSFGSATVSVPAADLPDNLVVTSDQAPTAPQASGHVATAGTGGALAHISVLTCSFNVVGTPNATWTNGTSGQLKFTGTGTLHPASVSAGCFGEVGTSDTLTYTGTYTVTPTGITIS